ncbi:MAG: sigma-70 family RNA polymerase sigma factor [Candidatus Sulfotelmatobacter sp.]
MSIHAPVVPVIAFEVLMDAPTDVATLLGELNVGNDLAVADLVVLLYSELHRLASRYLQRERSDHTLQTTALVHEAYLRLADQREVHWKNREQFLGVAAQLMRRILVDYSRGHGAKKRGQGFEKVFLEEAAGVSRGKAADVIALDEALTRLAEFDPQQAQLVELRFFGGLSIEEAAGVLGVSRTTVKRNWNLSKAWLARELRKGDQKDA